MNDTFPVTITRDNELFLFKIAQYYDQKEQHIKFDVFLGGKQMASFEPDAGETYWICLNPGKLDQNLLHDLLSKIEGYY